MSQGHFIEVSWQNQGFKLWFPDRRDAEKILEAVSPDLGKNASKFSLEKMSKILSLTINNLDSGLFGEDEYSNCAKTGVYQTIYYKFEPDSLKGNKKEVVAVMFDLVYLRRFLVNQMIKDIPRNLKKNECASL